MVPELYQGPNEHEACIYTYPLRKRTAYKQNKKKY